MNFAWEVVLAADRCGIRREDIRFLPAQNGSPYTETVLEDINSSTLEHPEVRINPLYRFSPEFSRIFDVNLSGLEATREMYFDVFMHYISSLDLRSGLSKQEYYLRFFLDDILAEMYGIQAADAIRRFDKQSLRQLLRLIVKLYRCGSSIALFREAMRLIYPESIVYLHNERIRQVLIYIGTKETETERKKIDFLQDMFLEINYETYLFWEHHFGIIGVDETMVLDEMVLF